MLDIFIVISRELAEALLVIASLRLMAWETDRRITASPIVWSAVLGAIAGVLLMSALTRIALDVRLNALVSIAFSLSVLWTATSTYASANSLYGHVEDAVDTWLHRLARGPAVIGIAFLVTFREALEVMVFLRGVQVDPCSVASLSALGLALSMLVILVGAFRSIATRRSLLAAFRLSALLLAFVAIRHLLIGIGSLLQAMVPPDMTAPLTGFLAGGPWHAFLIAALMIPVLTGFVGNWWKESTPAFLLGSSDTTPIRR